MKVSDSVLELERQFREMRERAERAEGVIRVYEARDNARAVAVKATEDRDFEVTTKDSEKGESTVKFSPGLWLLTLAEDFIRNPRPFEISVTDTATDPNDPTQRDTPAMENLPIPKNRTTKGVETDG